VRDEKLSVNGFENSLQAAAAAVAGAGRQEESISSIPAETVESSQAEDRAKEQRIAELRKLYQSGEYKVDASATASRIVDEHLNQEPGIFDS